MKNKKFWRTFAALCTSLVLMGGFSVTAFAQGTEQPPEPGQTTEVDATNDSNVVIEETEDSPPLTPEGNAALVDDFGGNKQLITITTKAGNYFYILIDRANEDKETAVHFLNQVDDADLAALTEEGQTQEETPAVCTCTEKCEAGAVDTEGQTQEETPAVCTCTEKCEAGAVDTNCPVCSVNMTECGGKEPEPPEETPAPEEPEKAAGLNPAVLLLVLALMGGIGAVIYLKFIRKKPQTTTTHDPDDYEYDDGEEISDEEEIEIEDEESEEPHTDGGGIEESGDKQA